MTRAKELDQRREAYLARMLEYHEREAATIRELLHRK